MLKTRAMLTWEYEPQLGRSAEQAIGASEDRLNWMLSRNSDYEIAVAEHELWAFARAEGYYRGLSPEIRRTQIARLRLLYGRLYPSLRIYVYDARKLFSAPVTIFGPLMAVLYLGRHYIAFRDSARVADITAHFDGLVREAEIGARDVPAVLDDLERAI